MPCPSREHAQGTQRWPKLRLHVLPSCAFQHGPERRIFKQKTHQDVPAGLLAVPAKRDKHVSWQGSAFWASGCEGARPSAGLTRPAICQPCPGFRLSAQNLGPNMSQGSPSPCSLHRNTSQPWVCQCHDWTKLDKVQAEESTGLLLLRMRDILRDFTCQGLRDSDGIVFVT